MHQVISAELLKLLQMKAVTRVNNNNDAKPPPVTPMVREPIIRQLTHPELIKEVRGIHYSLVVIELLCQEEDSTFSSVGGRYSSVAGNYEVSTSGRPGTYD
ncbi:hypothetical protein AJ78_08891 [Emergomyces pasteurianus Ep9510]|uniref:Uncharacterized protein n=1 Tax=Emergomyces pasteurianus Ep9510 TaxID=1447872 RepID=A0A1J9P0W8_9EURO|nr:hypothetical protein AJ78_08891 [Emergomyces pasteurianus Ep9510]